MTVAVIREMREVGDRLSLTPKGLAALRWTIVDDGPASEPTVARDPEDATVSSLRDRRA